MVAGVRRTMAAVLQCLWLLLCGACLRADVGLSFVRSPEPIVAPPGDKVVFECSLNVPAEQVRWRHGGHFLHQQHLSSENSGGNHSKMSSHLVVKVDGASQAGDYQCVAWIGASALASVPARLSLAELHMFPPQSNQSYQVSVGNTVALYRDMPYSNPPALLQYYKNGLKLPATQQVLATTGTLILPNVTSQDSGVYTYSATNYITGQTITSPYTMELTVISRSTKQPPYFLKKPQSEYTVQIGKNVTLECSSVGNPPPKVTWQKLGASLPRDRAELVKGGLKLLNLARGDEGTYICEMSNGEGHGLSHIIMLHLQEPPFVLKEPKNSVVEEGGEVQLECSFKGAPSPAIMWLLNGESLLNDSHVRITGGKLILSELKKRHAGIFQCFATNELGCVYGSAMLRVSPKQVTAQPNGHILPSDSEEDGYQDLSDGVVNRSTPVPVIGGRGYVNLDRTRKGKGRRKDKKHKGSAVMIPPTRPNVTRLTDSSVMVRWGVPPNTGLPIQFFKVQHRELGRNSHRRGGPRSRGAQGIKGSRWKTNNEDIAPHIRSYEVDGLETDHTYRFRIAAVYSNNDNKLGPNSARFFLQKSPSNKNPLHPPKLTHTEAISPTAINIHWQYTSSTYSPVEGFYVYYRTTSSAGDYVKATVEGESKRSFVITHLLPDTAYDIKVQSFTIGAASDFSTILTHKTLSFPTEKPETTEVVSSGVGIIEPSNNQLYVVLGAVLGGLGLLVVLFIMLFICNRQRHANNQASQDSDQRQDKFSDPDLQMESVNRFMLNSKNVRNGCLPQNGYMHNRKMNITSNPLADAEQDKIQNVMEMSFLSNQNNNCSASAASGCGASGSSLSEDESP